MLKRLLGLTPKLTEFQELNYEVIGGAPNERCSIAFQPGDSRYDVEVLLAKGVIANTIQHPVSIPQRVGAYDSRWNPTSASYLMSEETVSRKNEEAAIARNETGVHGVALHKKGSMHI